MVAAWCYVEPLATQARDHGFEWWQLTVKFYPFILAHNIAFKLTPLFTKLSLKERQTGRQKLLQYVSKLQSDWLG